MSLITFNNRVPGLSNLLRDVFDDDYFTNRRPVRNHFIPAVNIRETENAYQIELALPGIDKKDVEVEVEGDLLKIWSNNEAKSSSMEDGYKRIEFVSSSFERSFTLPENADKAAIEAKNENGVLFIKLPKMQAKTGIRKQIKVS